MSTVPVKCEACHKAGSVGLLCQSCGSVLPPRPLDEFEVFGVPRRYHLDPAVLEARHRDLARAVHPDRFAKAAPRLRLLSLQAATTLNQALRVLRHPLRRAEALLRLRGVTIGENERADPELLMEIMELGERLHELEPDSAEAKALRAEVQARRDAAFAEIERLFGAGEGGGAELELDTHAIKVALIAIRYYDRLLEAGAGASDAAVAAG